MKSYQHKSIKRFSIDGNIHDDSKILRLRSEYERLLVLEMKLSGYARRLDIDSNFSLRYNSERNYFEFELSMYGIFVGKRQSECLVGIDGINPIYTQESKSKESLQQQELKRTEN